MKKWSKAKWIGLAILLPSIAAIIGSIYSIGSSTLMWVVGESTTGEILNKHLVPEDSFKKINTTSADSNAYIVSFQTSSGEEVVFKTNFSSSMDLYHMHEKVTIIYWRDSPESAKVLGFMSLYLGPLLAIFLGIVFGLIGIFIFLSDKPKRRFIKN